VKIDPKHFSMTDEALRVSKACHPILAGEPNSIQSAALVDLVASHIAGHVVPGNPKQTAILRAELLDLFMDAVKQLIPIADAEVIQPELKRRGL
jgi:hypothetical protein